MDRHREGGRDFDLGPYSADGTAKCHALPGKQSTSISSNLCRAGEGEQGGTGKPGNDPGRFCEVLALWGLSVTVSSQRPTLTWVVQGEKLTGHFLATTQSHTLYSSAGP